MKISNEHFNIIDREMRHTIAKYPMTLKELIQGYKESEKIKDWKKALRWAVFQYIDDRYKNVYKERLTKQLYKYLNDSHIDTALRIAAINNELYFGE